METLYYSVQGLVPFLTYFFGGIFCLLIFKWIYTKVTPHDEWQLVETEHNQAAAWGFGGAIIGFAIPMASAIENSVNIIDFILWAVIALLVQIFAFCIVRFLFMPTVVSNIKNNHISSGILLACVSIAIGLLNAAAMTY